MAKYVCLAADRHDPGGEAETIFLTPRDEIFELPDGEETNRLLRVGSIVPSSVRFPDGKPVPATKSKGGN